jgi:type IV pilus assembly protein PilE
MHRSFRTASDSNCRPSAFGFTLIELMIALVVAALLAAVALPSYFGQLRKTRRAEAVAVTSQIQQAQERFRANCPCYAHSVSNATSLTCPGTCPGTGADAGLGIAAVAGARYTYTLTNVLPTSYTLRVDAVLGSSQASDTGCTQLFVTVAAGTATQTPAQCWSR